MSSNDDLKQQSEEATKGGEYSDAPVASVMLDDRVAGADESSTDNLGANEVSSARSPSNQSMPQEFTFFQKKKCPDQAVLTSSVAYASTAQVTAFTARLDGAVTVNAKTQRHIAELMVLMSDVASTFKPDESTPQRKRLRRSKWLFYGCLVGFSVGWFLLFPFGHTLITQLTGLIVR